MKKYLVTGAAGFIGSQLAKNLLKNGHQVVSIDNLSTGYLEAVPEGVELIVGDCQDEKVIEKLYDHKFDAIFHIAGQSSGEVSFENPVYDLQTNTQSTLLLLQYAKNTDCQKMIYASSMSVYGDQKELPVKETAKCNPKSFYAVGKLASEHYLKIYSNLGITCTALRLFNVYGPGQNLENLKQGMLSIFLAMALKDGKILVKGDKNRFRDFVYIDDVVKAFRNAEAMEGNDSYRVFNVCNNRKITIEELLNNLNCHFDNQLDITYSGGTPGDQFGIFGDEEKMKTGLLTQGNVQFEQGVNEMVSWAKGI